MEGLGIREDDLDETFVRSSGSGGQNVNKVATCVMLLHRPSGVRIKCQTTRTQGMNRYLARRMLADAIETAQRMRLAEQRQRAEQERRKRRGRPERLKQKMLEGKRARSKIKAGRRPPMGEE
jgi:protein subunit release factor B